MIKGTTKLLGVIGDPVEHSLSPIMHNSAIAHLGVDYVYLPFHIKAGDLDAALAGFSAIGVQGFSITIPHKQTIISRLSTVSKTAQAVGAVNTVWRTPEGWGGTNTDVTGFLAPLKSSSLLNLSPLNPRPLNPHLSNREADPISPQSWGARGAKNDDSNSPQSWGARGAGDFDSNSPQSTPNVGDHGGEGTRGATEWNQKVAVILGNGGASRAVVAGCAELGVAEIHIVGRNLQKLEVFQQSWLNSPLAISVNIHVWDNLPELISQADLLVNTTPVGMYPNVAQSPVNQVVMDKIKSSAIAYDLIYTPSPTQFLKMATERGATAIDGLEMLVQQGAVALELWLNQAVPVDIMRQSLRKKLGLE